MISSADEAYLDAAIDLGRRGLFSTTPNPSVGCLFVRGGKVLGRGWHVRAGEGHAEVNALKDAGGKVQGSTAYVSLEPCAFEGRTPACADTLIEAGVRRVVVAMEDPHPRVDGEGINRLRDAGVEVDVLEVPAARELVMGYATRQTTGKPFVRLKIAQSLDGRTAMASGESQWITGVAARADVQYWRARSCAVITGIGTVLEDNPSLTVRDDAYAVDGNLRQPLRVVCDSHLRIPADARLLAEPGAVLLAHHADASPSPAVPADYFVASAPGVAGDAGAAIDLERLLAYLGTRGCNEVTVEAGATLVGGFLAAGLWDEIVLYIAPRFLGSSARPMAQMQLDTMNQALTATITDTRQIGDDLRVTLRRPTTR